MFGGIQVSSQSVTDRLTAAPKPAGSNTAEPNTDESVPVHLFGTPNGLFERHLSYDNVIEQTAADARDRFEAFARAVRDILSQRWVSTESTYNRLNPKRIYYLSMEFLIGRSLANNVMNLMLDPAVQKAVEQHSFDWAALLEEEPDAALGNGGLGRLAACFLDSMATMQLPAMGYGLRYH
jgi:glycogen phosphorylase